MMSGSIYTAIVGLAGMHVMHGMRWAHGHARHGMLTECSAAGPRHSDVTHGEYCTSARKNEAAGAVRGALSSKNKAPRSIVLKATERLTLLLENANEIVEKSCTGCECGVGSQRGIRSETLFGVPRRIWLPSHPPVPHRRTPVP